MFYFIVKIITFVVINSACTYNCHKLFCCFVIAFCTVVMPVVFLMYYGCFRFVCFYALILCVFIYITISTFYWTVLTLVRFHWM